MHFNDNVKVYITDDNLFKKISQDFKIIYEDNNILIIDKPTQIEVVGENSVTSILQNKYSFIETHLVFYFLLKMKIA